MEISGTFVCGDTIFGSGGSIVLVVRGEDLSVRHSIQAENSWARSLLLAGILAGFALRLHQLGAESLWYDETVSVYLARQSIPQMIAHTAGDIHPPGYYLLLHLWSALTSPSLAHGMEFLFTWPSLFAGMLILVLLFALGRRLFGTATGIVAVWLAAFNPFQLWYSQEVRMYTVGAVLALLCLWAAVRFLDRRRPSLWLAIYAISAAAGLYTLYYFAFWLIAINVVVLASLLHKPRRGMTRLSAWLAAQLGALLLFSPWLPIVSHQMFEPPVPPWRAPWNSFTDFGASLAETASAFVAGQSPPGQINWPWALLVTVTVILFAVHWPNARKKRQGSSDWLVLAMVLLPIAQLYLLTVLATPIYHIRYVFLYAPLFLLIPAALIVTAWQQHRRWSTIIAGLWLAVNAMAMRDFWSNPLYRADDHRTAVAALAKNWRPDDAILVNAGWAYTVLTTYWPTELVGVESFLPASLGQVHAIDDYAQNRSASAATTNNAGVARSGSVDGSPSLGWGNPQSDFFAIRADATQDALRQIANASQRLWQYRLYDTVSDPSGVIRQWLADNTTLLSETPIPGRDFGLVQLFATHAPPPGMTAPASSICFGEILCLRDYAQIDAVEAGSTLYHAQLWTARSAAPDLSASLRLYDGAGHLAAQADAPFLPPTHTWSPGAPVQQTLALPIGVSTKPGDYSLELIVYRQDSGAALSLPNVASSVDGQRLHLGDVRILPSSQIPDLPAPMATFDYIDMIQAQVNQPTVQPGDRLRTTLYWRPRQSSYRDTYQVVLTLTAENGEKANDWTFTLGGDEYPSGDWPALLPVRDFYDLPLPETLAPGRYTVEASLYRASDGALIPAREGWCPKDSVVIGALSVEAP